MLLSQRESLNILGSASPYVLGVVKKREDIPLFDWIDPFATDIWTWIKDNRVLVALLLISVFFAYLWLKKE